MSSHASMGEEVIRIEWEQKPQRSRWAAVEKAGNGRSSALPTIAAMGTSTINRKSSIHVSSAAPASNALVSSVDMGWEYLDHTADVQIHAWGLGLGSAFCSAALGMFGYMVELSEFKDADLEADICADAHDLESLLFNFLDECLYLFHSESFVVTRLEILKLNLNSFQIEAKAHGASFDASVHSQGTEVKAITYSNMKIEMSPSSSSAAGDDGRADVYVIVDI